MNYHDEYQQSIEQPEVFWRKQAEQIKWYEFPETILSQDEHGFYRWFAGGKLNTAYLALDVHIEEGRGDQLALVYDSPAANMQQKFTYAELRDTVAKFAGCLRNLGVEKGDRVIIYMPMVPEAAIAMLACARVGAVHSVVFAGFGAGALAERIRASDSRIVLTADIGYRKGTEVQLKEIVDSAMEMGGEKVEHVVVLRRTAGEFFDVNHQVINKFLCIDCGVVFKKSGQVE